MTEPPPISLVCLDLAGIVIDDSVVERAYAEAIATQGIVPGTQDYARSMVRFDRSRGRPPAACSASSSRPTRCAPRWRRSRSTARSARPRSGSASASRPRSPTRSARRPARAPRSPWSPCCPGPPASDLLGSLRDADLVLCADDVPRSFPWPDPVLTAMLRLGTGDVREVAVVSATEDGVLSGHRAGAGPGRGHRLRRPLGRGAPRGGRHARARQHRRASPTCSPGVRSSHAAHLDL